MGSSEGLGPRGVKPPGLCREVAALTAREARNQLVICFSDSVLLPDPLPSLIKTNMHSLTSRRFGWLNAHCSRCSQGRAGAYGRMGREGKGDFFPGCHRALQPLFSLGAGLACMRLRHSLWSTDDLWVCSFTVPRPGAFPSGSCYSLKSLLAVLIAVREFQQS